MSPTSLAVKVKKPLVVFCHNAPSSAKEFVLEYMVKYRSTTIHVEKNDIAVYVSDKTGYRYDKVISDILPALRALKMDGEPITITEHHFGAGEKRTEIRYAEQDPNYFVNESKDGLTLYEFIKYQEKLEKLVLNYLKKFTSSNFYSTPQGIAYHISKQIGVGEKFLIDEILPIIYKLISKGENIKVTQTFINGTQRTEIRYFTNCLGLGDK